MINISCGENNTHSVFNKLNISDDSYNLILTTNIDCSSCIDQIIFGKRDSKPYYGVVFSHSQKSNLEDFSYAVDTKDWVSWHLISDKELFLAILDFSENRQTPLLFEIEDNGIKTVRSLK
ncbi:hypothetical protein MM213_06750 [Belliella sp. R4-6]|uniref:Lipoprotein n=1 Tax=Belliella alkalica TaxID=1730871 RepID=A0ABS9VAT3_9BACT|nr:hypothetical protein [Belliella alkalica]MCH7413175.1 hypothetical protein [Belliella alkalica]